MSDLMATFVGGPYDGETMVLPTQDGVAPETMKVGDYANDGTVKVRPNDVFQANWELTTYTLDTVVAGVATYTVAP